MFHIQFAAIDMGEAKPNVVVRPAPESTIDINTARCDVFILDGRLIILPTEADERTKRIPVVVLTTTHDLREVSRCYDLGCNVYVTKPIDYQQFSDAIRKLGLFLSIVTIPEGE